MTVLRLFLLSLFATPCLLAQNLPAPIFRAGDRWAAVGDSITHGGGYHSYVYLYYVTRYPEQKFTMTNAGISGDSATGAVRRYDWDIKPFAPTVASIMLGMNDVGRGNYSDKPDTPEIAARKKGAIERHVAAMTTLAQKLRDDQCRLIFITPSIFDQTSTMDKPNNFGVNDALGICGQKARELAAQHDSPVVDFHGAMSALNAKVQQGDPAATIVGGDRVHPGPAGHLLMAYYFLKDCGAPKTVARVEIDAAANAVRNTVNCEVEGLSDSGGEMKFNYLAKSLPFPLPPGTQQVLTWLPELWDELCEELLVVKGLPAGEYTLLIDDVMVVTADQAAWAAGVNLGQLEKSPMLQQATEVMKLNQQRHSIGSRYLRNFAMWRHSLSGEKGLDFDDYAAVVERINAKNAARSSNQGYFNNMAKVYTEHKPREAEYIKQEQELTDEMWAKAKPLSRRMFLRPAKAGDKP
ncbi:MAG: SGNH/GDSL hydrolase family protein [Lentisphaeria bacterium]|jgi:lysophospholipase L1-like esterase